MNRQPQVSVGILTAQRIGFVLHGDYTAAGKTVAGRKPGFGRRRPGAMGRSVLRAFAVRTVRGRCFFYAERGGDRDWFSLAADRRPGIPRRIGTDRGRRTGYGRQPYRRRRVSRKRDCVGDERFRIARTSESPCGDFAQLVAGADRSAAGGACCGGVQVHCPFRR